MHAEASCADFEAWAAHVLAKQNLLGKEGRGLGGTELEAVYLRVLTEESAMQCRDFCMGRQIEPWTCESRQRHVHRPVRRCWVCE